MCKKIISILLAVVMLVGVMSMAGCKKEEQEPANVVSETNVEQLDYTFGENETFYSEEPVTYSMYFSDASWYPMVDTWKTEGVFEKIREKTNVTLDLTSFDSSDYTNKVGLEINSGAAKYIIPKIYEENQYVNGGAVVPVSDYVQYMPNYNAFVKEYGLEADIATIVQADGKYYRLPGLHESTRQDYSLIIRKDIFDAAGVDVVELEKTWTWEDLCDALIKVKAYMVENGLCKEKDYIWSDLWCGTESGQGNGGCLLKLIASSYGVKSGWAVGNTLVFDEAAQKWYCGSLSDNYKKFVSVVNKLIVNGILDPETFTQDDTTAHNQFYNGNTVIQSTNQSTYATDKASVASILGEGNFELYLPVSPKGINNYITESGRLECGVMISKNALDDLGESGFIKMMRFVDWLWYSDDAYTLTKWGVEGETYKTVKDEATGVDVKQLLDGYKCSGLGISGADEDTDIRLQWGYACGNFFYGHRSALRDDNLIPDIQDLSSRMNAYRENKPLEPSVALDEDMQELLSLTQTSVVDTVNTWTLNFVTGQSDIDADWDAYVSAVKAAGIDDFVSQYNAAYNG